MDKVIELAKQAGIVFPETQEDSFTCWIEELTKFYELARADLEAENAKLKEATKLLDLALLQTYPKVFDLWNAARIALGEQT